ncbi:hypothetical protein MYCTH_66448 [Thermothelomyces thermophilus ATCC 42464]|uniref:Uncharacterized protein n=1 Tax=Thermothelomyces thermophilus (strain ATCC 42464 / BCRC 31852 / DSM 1799) TaxID=573729 RepID=G2QB33_THET4|nr:uncharacterized protein MYCTH_66448 [Thermothelomyces thermophilus ATCC 42464]AEO55971.1 hypothetical protein MYCTH_66448 [Thermothelomyces thermophilus ATCC 42464]
MPIEKRKSHSARYRASLAQNIAENGFVVMPCSWCASQGLVCKMIARTSVAKPTFVEVVFAMALAYRFLPWIAFSRSSVVLRMLNVVPNLSWMNLNAVWKKPSASCPKSLRGSGVFVSRRSF